MRDGRASVGHPVDVASGTMSSALEDFSISGSVDLVWTRFYSTALLGMPPTLLGPGWTTRYFCTLTRETDGFRFITPDGAPEMFVDPVGTVDRGGILRNFGTFQELFRSGDQYVVTRWDVDTHEVERYVFQSGPRGEVWPLASIENVAGQALDLVRDRAGQLRGILQRLERRGLWIEYASGGRIATVSLASRDSQRRVLVRYEYDGAGRLSAAYDALGQVDRYEYDERSRVTREVVKDGGVFSFVYDRQGRCVRTSGLDRYDEKTFRYFDNTGWTEVTNSLGHVTRFQWRRDGQVVAEHDSTGGARRLDYDDFGRIVGETATSGAKFIYAFDDHGNRHRTEDPLGKTSELTFNDAHLPLTFVDPRGSTWRRFYDEQNRLVAAEDPLQNRFQYQHDIDGRLVGFVDPLGHAFTQAFSADGSTVELSDGRGRRVRYVSDEAGQVRERTDPTGATITFRYDACGRPVEIGYPDGTRVQGSWDAGGNLVEYVDRTGRRMRYRFGPCRRLLAKQDASGAVFRYEWSTEPGRLLAMINPAGEEYRFDYDEAGRIIREIGFDGRKIELEYDGNGRVAAATNGAGERTGYVRDPMGRLLAQLLPDGSATSFAYDAMGAILSATNDQVEVTIERDPLGRIVREQQGRFAVRRSYDAMGRVTRVEPDIGPVVAYQWDHIGDVVAVSAGHNARWEIRRNLRGEDEQWRLPGNLELSHKYGSAGQLLSQELTRQGTVLTRREYFHDGPLPTGFEDSRQGSVAYGYDAGERLVGVRRTNGPAEEFAYDSNGSLTTIKYDGVTESLSYEPGGRVRARGPLRYEYDDNGRLVRRFSEKPGEGGWHFNWNAVGQLREAVDDSGRSWRYRYDAFGRLVERAGPHGTTSYLWDDDVILNEVAGDRVTATWVFDPDAFRPIGVLRGDRPASALTDRLGTPYQLVDSSGRVVWAVRYRAWGKAEPLVGDLADCPIRFPGQWWMPETDLHYNRYRHYDPSTGRFVSPDPAGLTNAPSLYTYGRNPIRWLDPYGLINEFVGDSNLFMDRPERAATTRPICDDILADSNNKVIVPKAVRNEATANDPAGTQAQRLTNSNATVEPVRSANVKGTIAAAAANPDPNAPLLSRNFDENDLKLMATAKQKGLPVVTNNSRLKNQIQNNATRKALFGNVKIIVVGEDIKSANDLACMK